MEEVKITFYKDNFGLAGRGASNASGKRGGEEEEEEEA